MKINCLNAEVIESQNTGVSKEVKTAGPSGLHQRHYKTYYKQHLNRVNINWKEKNSKRKEKQKKNKQSYTSSHIRANGPPTKVGWVSGHVALSQSLSQTGREESGVFNK